MEHGHTSTKHGQHGAEESGKANAPLVEVDAEECRRKKVVAPDEGAGFGKRRPSPENHEGMSCKKTKIKAQS